MEVNSHVSHFQEIIIEYIKNKLNMMLTETFQLTQEVDFNDYTKLTQIVLKEISRGHVQSAHMTKEDAEKAIKIFDTLNCQSEIGRGLDTKSKTFQYTEDNNPFADSPF